MSGSIILIFNLQLVTSSGMIAGKLGETIYVRLLKTSWSHVAVTKINFCFIIFLQLFFFVYLNILVFFLVYVGINYDLGTIYKKNF